MLREGGKQVPWFIVGLVIGVITMAALPSAPAPMPATTQPSAVAAVAAGGGSGAFCRVAGSRYFFNRDFETRGEEFTSFERWCADRHSPVEFAP